MSVLVTCLHCLGLKNHLVHLFDDDCYLFGSVLRSCLAYAPDWTGIPSNWLRLFRFYILFVVSKRADVSFSVHSHDQRTGVSRRKESNFVNEGKGKRFYPNK